MMMRIGTLMLGLVLAVLNMLAQSSNPPAEKVGTTKNSNPDATQIVTSDINLFWKAYDAAKPENNLIVFRDQYLKAGSPGLKAFTRARIFNSCELVDAIEKHPKYYASIRESSLRVESFKDHIRTSLRKFKEIYPEAVFPNVYFLIGKMNSAGTEAGEGLLIGVDMFGRTKDMPLDELSAWHKAVIEPIEDIPFVVAHELVHYQQKYPNLTVFNPVATAPGTDLLLIAARGQL